MAAEDWVESAFRFPNGAEAGLIQFLKSAGFSRPEIVQTRQKDTGIESVCVYNRPAQARDLAVKFRREKFKRISLRQKLLTPRDWAEKWKEDYRIQKLGRRFVIIPAWRKKEYKPAKFIGRIPVYIDPLSAFGSGEHETTQLMTRMLEGLKGKFESFIDMGTGTGILAIIAAHLGAKKISAFDSDKPSVQCAKSNFSANGLKGADFRSVELARWPANPKFDLVAANINSRILEKHRRPIVNAAKKGGIIVVSGILKQTYDSFRGAFGGKDLRIEKILRGRRWVCVLYRKAG